VDRRLLRLLVEKVLAELPDVDVADLTLEGLQGILVVTEKSLTMSRVVLMRLELCRVVLVGLLGVPQEGAEAVCLIGELLDLLEQAVEVLLLLRHVQGCLTY
jgi:hypothetical protein